MMTRLCWCMLEGLRRTWERDATLIDPASPTLRGQDGAAHDRPLMTPEHEEGTAWTRSRPSSSSTS